MKYDAAWLIKSGALTVTKDGEKWKATYKNVRGELKEIGSFATQETAARAGVLWIGGLRFDSMRAEYERGVSLDTMALWWQCGSKTVIDCVLLGGALLRAPIVRPVRAKRNRQDKFGARVAA